MIDLRDLKPGDLVRPALYDPASDEQYIGVVVCFEGVNGTTQPSGRVGVRWYSVDGRYDDGYSLYWPHELRAHETQARGAASSDQKPIGFVPGVGGDA